jgi:hypothetical protein
MSEKPKGITMGLFIAGIVIAIFASTLVSTVISLQYSFGPKGEQGTQGVQGIQGIQGVKGDIGLQGPEGNVSLENISGWLPSPAYDSGWTLISGSVWHNFTHGLNTTELVVYMLGKDQQGDIYQIGQYGSSEYWRIASSNEILAMRDPNAAVFLVRVFAWKIPRT